MKNNYELMMIFPVKISREDIDGVFEEIKKLIGKDGKVKESKDMGHKILAYTIKKEKEGNYHLMVFESPADKIIMISEFLKHNEKVLRYLIVRV